MKQFIIENTEVGLYQIGEIAKAIRKSVKTIRRWEKLGLLPKPVYKSKGRRLYTSKNLEDIIAWKKKHKMKQGYRISKTSSISWETV